MPRLNGFTIVVIMLLVLTAAGVAIVKMVGGPDKIAVKEPKPAKEPALRDEGNQVKDGGTKDGTAGTQAEENARKKLESDRQDAYKQMAARDWCAAKKRWQDILAQKPATDIRTEAEHNLQILKDLCPTQPESVYYRREPSPEELAKVPVNQKPAELSEDEIVKFYRPGKTVRSVALVNITGSGVHKDWGLKQRTNFAHEFRTEVVTKVLRNEPRTVVFHQKFDEVSQLLAYSKSTLELELPVSPLLTIVVDHSGNIIPLPQYLLIKQIIKIIEIADPGLKMSLTRFKNYFPNASPDMQMAAQIQALSGQELEIEYVSGWGVSKITVLNGEELDQDLLKALASKSGLFMDAVVGKVEKLQDGETFDVPSRDVSDLLNLGYDCRTDGNLSFKRKGVVEERGEKLLDLTLSKADLAVEANDDGVERVGKLRAVSGTLLYSSSGHLVRSAKAEWTGSTDWASKNHLLFGLKDAQNVTIRSRYEAKIEEEDKQ